MSDHGGNNVVYVAGEEEDAGDNNNTSRKVMEFKNGVFQASKVMESDCGLGKSWNSTSRSWILLTEG